MAGSANIILSPATYKAIEAQRLYFNESHDAIIRQLGSGLVDQSQKMTVAARAMAERKTVGHRS